MKHPKQSSGAMNNVTTRNRLFSLLEEAVSETEGAVVSDFVDTTYAGNLSAKVLHTRTSFTSIGYYSNDAGVGIIIRPKPRSGFKGYYAIGVDKLSEDDMIEKAKALLLVTNMNDLSRTLNRLGLGTTQRRTVL